MKQPKHQGREKSEMLKNIATRGNEISMGKIDIE
jgi:hypothetical protein